MTLTEVSYYSRRLLPFFIILCLVFLVFFYAVRVFFLYLEANKPAEDMTSPSFGVIKRPQITTIPLLGKLNITLDTVEGQPVTPAETAQVFGIPPTTSRFGFREKIYLMAKTLKFDTEVTKHTLADTLATFVEGNKKLSVDITNFNFSYELDVAGDAALFQNTSIPQEQIVKEKAVDFLRALGRYPEELSKGKAKTTYHIFNTATNELSLTLRPQDANVVEVDFYRPDIGEINIVTPKFYSSQNHVIMVFNEEGFTVIKAQVKFFEKVEEVPDPKTGKKSGIYALKTGEQAFKELQEGRSLVVSHASQSQDVAIKKMFLGYLDVDTYQENMQPVYVFLGSDYFVGYVPAIIDEFLAK